MGGAPGFEQMLKVTVLQISGAKVCLGFEADPAVPIHRAEIWERIQSERRPNTAADGLGFAAE